MGRQISNKTGKQSSAQKQDTARRGGSHPLPKSKAHAGASGEEGAGRVRAREERNLDRSGGKRKPTTRRASSG